MRAVAPGFVGICLFSLCGAALAQDVPPPSPEQPATKAAKFIIQLEHVPVADVAVSLQQFVRGNDEIKILPLTLSNSLLVAGVEGEDRTLLEDLVGLIDRKPPAVDVDVTIVQSTAPADAESNFELSGDAEEVKTAIEELEQSGGLKVLERLHLTTIDNQLAQVQVGKSQPMARGVNFAGPPGSGRSVPSFVMENVGSVLTATSRVSGNDVLIELAIERSWVPEAKPAGDGEASSFRPEETQKLQIRSTVRVPKGQAVHVGGMTVKADGKQTRISAIVTAKVSR